MRVRRQVGDVGEDLGEEGLGEEDGIIDGFEGGAEDEGAVWILRSPRHVAFEPLEEGLTILGVSIPQAAACDPAAVLGVHHVPRIDD